jgi:hypothetical protein
MDPSDLGSDFGSDYKSDSNSGANIEPLSLDLLPLEPLSEPSSGTSTPKHSIRTRIQAISFLELNIPHFEIIAKTGISKA